MMTANTTIRNAFERARHEHRAALIPYITAGYPSLDHLEPLVQALEAGGADLIEIGVPFSDPLADGPILQQAATEALAAGVKVQQILDRVAALRVSVPLVFLTYVNPIYRRGIERFIEDSHRSGIQGLIVPDWPWVEMREAAKVSKRHRVAMIPFVAPTSTDAHLHNIRSAEGFVYTVSVTGVTGARTHLDQGVGGLVARIREQVKIPIAVGFGISTPEQARETGKVADGVIVGSALVKVIRDHPDNPIEAAQAFVGSFRNALETK